MNQQDRWKWHSVASALGLAKAGIRAAASAFDRMRDTETRDELLSIAARIDELKRQATERSLVR